MPLTYAPNTGFHSRSLTLPGSVSASCAIATRIRIPTIFLKSMALGRFACRSFVSLALILQDRFKDSAQFEEFLQAQWFADVQAGAETYGLLLLTLHIG